MRDIFTTAEANERGISRRSLNWSVKAARRANAGHGAYAEGAEPVTALHRSIAAAKATGGGISGTAAGEFYELDSVTSKRIDFTVRPGASNARKGARRRLVELVLVDGIRVTNGTQTMLDLAACLDDVTWEQALESALRKDLTTIEAIVAALPAMSKARTPGVALIRRVLALRPTGAPATGSLLETLAIQLFRDAGLPTPMRQVTVFNRHGTFVARVDLAWPELGVFVELDGQGHKGQPVYDASRQNRVAGATGWLVARFTRKQITRNGKTSVLEVLDLFEQAALRGSKHGSAR